MKLTLEEALMRWSAVCADRRAFAGGFDAALLPFLAGWAMRDMGAKQPGQQDLGVYCGSFRAGWSEADAALLVLARETVHPFSPEGGGHATGGPYCDTCGLARAARCHE